MKVSQCETCDVLCTGTRCCNCRTNESDVVENVTPLKEFKAITKAANKAQIKKANAKQRKV